MSTQRPHEEHGLLAWLLSFLRREEPQPTGWQRYQPEPEPRREQHTDGVPAIQYPLHQPALPYDPEHQAALAAHAHYQQWLIEQRELHPRYVDPEKTGPKSREQVNGLLQQIVPQSGSYTPPAFGRSGDTEGIRKLGQRSQPFRPNRLQQLNPAELPDFLQARVPNMTSGSLPVQKQASDTQMTWRPNWFVGPVEPFPEGLHLAERLQRGPQLDPLARHEALHQWQPSGPLNALPPCISDPSKPIEEWPTVHYAATPEPTENQWLNGVEYVQVWADPDKTTLNKMDSGSLAACDKFASSVNPLGVTQADMQPDLSVAEPTELSRKVRDQRAIEQLLNETKESE